MYRRSLLAAAASLLWSIAAAAPVDVPELGVRFANLPAGIEKFDAVKRPTGWQATAPLGGAILEVYREDKPLESGDNVTDAAWRATVFTRFSLPLDPNQGALTTVGGKNSWVVVGVRQESGRSLYTCITVTDVDKHLYFITVRAVGPAKRPEEFDSLVKAIPDVAFGAVRRSDAAAARAAASTSPPLPPFVSLGGRETLLGAWTGTETLGVVDVRFRIDGQGRAQELRQLYSEPRDFGAIGLPFLQAGLFGVAPDWEEAGSQNQEFTLEMQFPIITVDAPCPDRKGQPRIPGAAVMVVCARHQ